MNRSLSRRARVVVTWMCCLAATWASDAPTQEQWQPVQSALAAKSADAGERLDAIIAKFPTWIDGHLARARLKLEGGDLVAAYASAYEALKIDGASIPAGRLAIQALGRRERYEAVYNIANRFTGYKDKDGWVNFDAASMAIAAKDLANAEKYLALAMQRAVTTTPKEFLFLEGRIALLAKDLERAEIAFQRAAGSGASDTGDKYPDALFELGRVIFARAGGYERQATRQDAYVRAESCFRRLVALQPRDAEAQMYLGRILLAQGRDLIEANEVENGKERIRAGLPPLREALNFRPGLLPAQLALGEALLQLEMYVEGIPYLESARAQGVKDRDVLFNLAQAYSATGRKAEADAIFSMIPPRTANELVSTGMAAYRAGNFASAADMLRKAADMPELLGKTEVRASALRYSGHAQRKVAETVSAKAEVDARLDAAVECYRLAGEAGDHIARRWFLAVESARDPFRAYAAGWQYLAWKSYLAPAGWAVVVGNYGPYVTGGEGLTGMRDRHPVHVLVWTLLILVPIVLFVLVRLRKPVPVEPPQPAARPPRTQVPKTEAVPTRLQTRTSTLATPTPAMPTPPPPTRPPPTSPTLPARRVPPPAGVKTPTEPLQGLAETNTPPAEQRPVTRTYKTPAPGMKTPAPGNRTRRP